MEVTSSWLDQHSTVIHSCVTTCLWVNNKPFTDILQSCQHDVGCQECFWQTDSPAHKTAVRYNTHSTLSTVHQKANQDTCCSSQCYNTQNLLIHYCTISHRSDVAVCGKQLVNHVPIQVYLQVKCYHRIGNNVTAVIAYQRSHQIVHPHATILNTAHQVYHSSAQLLPAALNHTKALGINIQYIQQHHTSTRCIHATASKTC